MNFIFNKFVNFTILAVVFSAAYSVSAQTRQYRVTDNQVKTVITRIETRTDDFRNLVESYNDRQVNSQNKEQLVNYISDFADSTNALNDNFTSRRSTSNDVQEVLNRAAFINSFMRSNRFTTAAQNQWNSLRSDLNILAGYYRVSWSWNTVPTYPTNTNTNTNNQSYRATDSQVETLIKRIENNTDAYRRQIERVNNRRNTQTTDQLSAYVNDFETATDNLSGNFTSRKSSSGDVQDVLNRAAVIDNYMRNNRLNSATESQWNLIRTDLDTLAGYYRVSWNWNNVPTYPTNTNSSQNFDTRLTGTYRLNTTQSDNITTAIDRAYSNNTNQRDRMRPNLERRLASPEMLVFDKRGQQVTFASSLSQQVVFNADGTSRSETNQNGKTVQIRTTATNNDLTIDYSGDRINDFNIVFAPSGNNQLRVTRRLYLENQNQTITVNSVYDKTDQTARWDNIIYQNNYPTGNTNGGTTSNDYIIANNTAMIATLDAPLSTKNLRDGDRFTMTVTSPSQYQGAIIEGRVNAQKSGVVSGRANLTLDFDTIRLTNGTTYRFAGIVDRVRQPNGDNVSVNNEGTVRDSNQTTKTVTRAGIGAALGAIIGAIAGGGQGAAIGAGIGAGAGAGSVILQGRDNLDLATGSEFSITATAPVNR